MDLFQHFVDVNAVGFLPPPLLFLITGAYGFSLAGFLGSTRRVRAWKFHMCVLAVNLHACVWSVLGGILQ